MSVEDNKQHEMENNRFTPISIGDLYAIEYSEGAWVVEGFIPAGGITILSGAPATFKTMLCMELAKCIASGDDFLDKMTCRQSGVLMIDEENSRFTIQQRFKMLGVTDALPIQLLIQNGFIADECFVSEVLGICTENNIGVIFIDSLVRVSNVDENDASQISKMFRVIKKLCHAGKTVVIIHHERKEQAFGSKSASSRLRGSSDILAVADAHISLTREKKDGKDIVLIKHNKMRNSKELEPFRIELIASEDEIRFLYTGPALAQTKKKADEAKEVVLDVLKTEKDGLSMGEICKRVKKLGTDVGEKNIKEAIDMLVQEKEISVKNGGKNKKICSLNTVE